MSEPQQPEPKPLLDMVEVELRRRLQTAAAAEDIPGGQLASLYTNLMKVEQAKPEVSEVGDSQDEVDVIVNSPLPWDKKRALLEAALSRLDVRRAEIVKLLEGETTDV